MQIPRRNYIPCFLLVCYIITIATHLSSNRAEATSGFCGKDPESAWFLRDNKCCPRAGLFLLKVPRATNKSAAVIVQCDSEGFIHFQSRCKNSDIWIDFHRSWADYREGFGDLGASEFWLGNAALHWLTRDGSRLRVELQHAFQRGVFTMAEFRVAGEGESFRLTWDGLVLAESNMAGYPFLAHHNNSGFYTADRDGGLGGRKCAREFRAGWWYNNCYQINLNGDHRGREGLSPTLLGFDRALRHTHNLEASLMKVRPHGC